MARMGRLGAVTSHIQKFNFQLQGGIGQKPQELGFRYNFLGHEVENEDVERTDILVLGATIVHHKNILCPQDIYCR